jgi:hypothetical protein
LDTTWARVLNEIQKQAASNPVAVDTVRRAKIAAVERETKRPLVIYVTAWTTPGRPIPPDLLQIDFSDKTGFREVTEQIEGPDIDVLLHSPGGLAEATEAIVELLRARFQSIRFIIPNGAKSAATMLALSGDEILMDEASELGPIDPQMGIMQGGGVKFSPADAILAQFEEASKDIKQNPDRLSVWIPIIAQMGPSLLVECTNAKKLSENLVKQWLEKYMFKGDPDASQKANRISSHLADHKNFLSHAKRVGMADLVQLGVKVKDLRTEPNLRNAVWELYCAIDITLANSAACKIVENSKGHAVVRQSQMMMSPFVQVKQPDPKSA